MLKTFSLLILICCLFTIVINGCIWSLDNPSDSHSNEYTVKSEASISIESEGPFYQNEEILVWGGVKSKPVEESGLVCQYQWDFGNDGTVDTVLYKSSLLKVPLKQSGKYSISLHLYDALGYVSSAAVHLDVSTPKDWEIDLFSILDVLLDSNCAFYSQSEHTMRPVVMMGRYLTYKNKTESMSLGSFVFEFLKNLIGTIDYNALILPYKHSFSNGVYTIDNGELTMKAAFLYGSTVEGAHKENDTIRYNVFDPRSYIKSFDVKLSAPYYSYEKGPLWDLCSGFSVNTSNPLSPKITLDIDLQSLKFTAFREIQGRYTLSAQELDPGGMISYSHFEMIPFRYHGLARINPFYIKDVISLVQNDSLEIDMSGSIIETDSFAIKFKYADGTILNDKSFNFFVRQQMLDQLVRFGNSGNNYKVTGSYTAECQLSVNVFALVSSFFKGSYSTTGNDTASFYCDRELQSHFGTLYFAVPQENYMTFISERYSYQFSIMQGTILP
ncbi:MAG: hypothetical protein GX267_14695 [Fibrobacter sp.]|mgnify:CR=1 FL=1|jgi:hypothetical protein|nr:hypothetical protein [Fibrobacter sp.]